MPLWFGFADLGVQGLPPGPMRRRVARWVGSDAETPLMAAFVPFAVGAIWTLPFLGLFGLGWLIWLAGRDALVWLADCYFDILLWLTHLSGGF